MTWKKVRKFAEGLVAFSRTVLKKDGYHTSLVFVLCPSGTWSIVQMTPPKGEPVWQSVYAAVRRLEGVAYVFVGEAWCVRLKDHRGDAEMSLETLEKETLREGIRPSQHPDREEILCVVAVHPQGQCSWITPFSKTTGGVTLGECEMTEEVAGGLLTGLERAEPGTEK